MAIIEQDQSKIMSKVITAAFETFGNYRITHARRCPGSKLSGFCDEECQNCEFPKLVKENAQKIGLEVLSFVDHRPIFVQVQRGQDNTHV
jgi:hypothetical protein